MNTFSVMKKPPVVPKQNERFRLKERCGAGRWHPKMRATTCLAKTDSSVGAAIGAARPPLAVAKQCERLADQDAVDGDLQVRVFHQGDSVSAERDGAGDVHARTTRCAVVEVELQRSTLGHGRDGERDRGPHTRRERRRIPFRVIPA